MKQPNTPPRWLLALAILGALIIHSHSLVTAVLKTDDFGIVLRSYTFSETLQNLWHPTNEHTWPLFRLLTYGLVTLVGKLTLIPLVLMLFTHLLPILVMLLLDRFLRHEQFHPLAGPVALLLFGVTTVYSEAVSWYAASPPIASLIFGLLGLLSAQAWLKSQQWWQLLLCGFWMMLAPGWFAGGVLLGPIGSLYLLGKGIGQSRWWAWLVPTLGTTCFLTISLTQSASQIMHAEHYQGKTAVQAFSPKAAIINTGRSLVDHTLLANLGVHVAPQSRDVAMPTLIVLVLALGFWLWRAPHRRVVFMGLALILLNNLLIYGARAAWSYEMQLCRWSRYQVFPQLGLAFIIGGGIGFRNSPAVTTWQLRHTYVFLAVFTFLFARQMTWKFDEHAAFAEAQKQELLRIEKVQALCVASQIGKADAIRVLTHQPILGSADHNSWLFLHGSSTPVAHTDEELKELLKAERLKD